MSVDWKEFMEGAVKTIGNLAKSNPKIMDGLGAFDAASQAHGTLDAKTRELISLAVAATTRCDTCIAIHAKAAADAGATREELVDTLAIAIGLNAGAALVYSSHILEAYDTLK